MAINFRRFFNGIKIVPKTTSTANSAGDMDFDTTVNKLNIHNGTSSSPAVTEAHSATLTNKSIDSDSNTLSNIKNSDIKAAAAISRSKLASGAASVVPVNDGSGVLTDSAVTSTELSKLSGLSGNITTDTNTQTLTNKSLVDSSTFIIDNVDNTKRVQIQAATVTTGTTRTLSVPDADTTIVGTDVAQTLTNKTIDAASNTLSNIPLSVTTGTLPINRGGTNSTTALNNNRVMQSLGGAIVEVQALTANRALASDANGIPIHAPVTATELGYVGGVTSAIQTQLNGKANQALSNLSATTDINSDLIMNTGAAALIKTKDSTVVASKDFTAKTGDSTLSASGDMIIKSGDAATGSSGNVLIQSGTAGTSRGSVTIDGAAVTVQSNNADLNLAAAGTGNLILSGTTISASGLPIADVADPTLLQDAATKNYVDTAVGGATPTKTYFSGYFSNASGWTTTSSGFVNGTNSGGNALTTRQSSGLTVTATGGNAAGVNFAPSAITDVYLVTVSFVGGGQSAGAGATFRLTDGTTTVTTCSNQVGGASTNLHNTMSGIFAPGTTSTVSLTVQLAAQSGGTVVITGIAGDLNPVMEWTIVKIA